MKTLIKEFLLKALIWVGVWLPWKIDSWARRPSRGSDIELFENFFVNKLRVWHVLLGGIVLMGSLQLMFG